MTDNLLAPEARGRAAETLARNVSAARVVLELSQDALAANAGLSRATINQIESGEGDPRLSTIVALAQALDVSPMFLLMTAPDLEAIVEVGVRPETASAVRAALPEDDLARMRRLIGSGIARNRNKALRLAVGAATSAGLVTGGASVGAALGSLMVPGIGTAFGAALGSFVGSQMARGGRTGDKTDPNR